MRGPRRYRPPLARISVRLLLLNLLLVFLPVAGSLYLQTYERQLLVGQERGMVQQGRVLAAALGERGELAPEETQAALARLRRRVDARLRVVDRRGDVIGDTSASGPRAAEESVGLPPSPARSDPLYRVGAVLYRLRQRLAGVRPDDAAYDRRPPPAWPEPAVRAALAGRYGALTRATGDGRSQTLHSAIPVRSGGEVVGAVLVSQSTWRILGALDQVRLGILRVFLASVAAAAVLTLLFATTVARPLERLRDEADALVDRRGRLRGRFRGSRRRDEIGDLARALEQLTRQIEGHLGSVEAFAADLSHELKNPLAAVRGAAELLAEVETPEERARFVAVVQREVARMERLLSGVREIGWIDARLDSEPAGAVPLHELLPGLVESWRERAPRGVAIELALPPGPVDVHGAPERVTQVFENLLDNAVELSPPGGRVAVSLAVAGGAGVATVADEGPGVPPEHLPRVFDRFFTWRPAEAAGRNGHSGLGLAIVKAIVEGYGGTVAIRNRPERGAAVEVRLPLC
ncbi:MAG TPA: ATP-binding protein [Thermoanaerobaculia bacterium]|nr:ATP-binding protein [Thermoanaerobaculia bacterium]